jgi:hypothetical protein
MRKFWLAIRRAVLMVACIAVLFIANPTSVSAQGFFESLFGGFSAAPARPVPQQAPASQQTAPSYRHQFYRPDVRPFQEPERRTQERQSRSSRGGYRTVCVRLCDGYYFPISHDVSARRFDRDAQTCQSRCPSSDVRLFYASTRSNSIADARDLGGNAYERLKNAFVYRQRKIQDCSCRPAPWSDVERARHEAYGMAEAQKRAESKRVADEAREAETGVPVSVAERLFASSLAEAMPPAPAEDWTTPEAVAFVKPRRVRVAENIQPQSPVRVRDGIATPGPMPQRHASKPVPRSYRLPRGSGQNVAARHAGSGRPMGLGSGRYRWPGD